MVIQSKLYNDLAKKTYSQEQFKKTIEQMMPMLIGNTYPDIPKELIDLMISGMQEEYQQALKIHSECLAQTYTEPQAAVLLAFYEENPWVLTKGVEFSMLSMQRMIEFAPNLADRIIDEYEKRVDEEKDNLGLSIE